MIIPNPYKQVPDYQFWRRSVSGRPGAEVDPLVSTSFTITRQTKVATAGSCFAQHIAKTLQSSGYGYMVTEERPASPAATDENYGVFTARFGNIYTIRQLLQLFDRAYGLFEPNDRFWKRADGRFVDPFRPMVQQGGFASQEDAEADRQAHFDAVQRMFESCDVFVFTLGLTEGWAAKIDEAVFPLAPGVVGVEGRAEDYAFRNFSVAQMESELSLFIERLRGVNPTCKIILTVSPVALIATFENRHVLTATTFSKAALRVVAEMVSRRFDSVDYFPSYEIITGPQTGGKFYEPDLREVRAEGVSYVMSIFRKHYMEGETIATSMPGSTTPNQKSYDSEMREMREMRSIQSVICDEERIEESL